MAMNEMIAKHETEENVEALNEMKAEAEAGYDSETLGSVEQALARIEAKKAEFSSAEAGTVVSSSEQTQIQNLGGDEVALAERTKDVDEKIKQVSVDAEKQIEEIKNQGSQKTEVIVEASAEKNIEEKKDILLERWQQIYDSYKRNDDKIQNGEKFIKELKDSGMEVEIQSFDKLSNKFNISKNELFKQMPKVYESASEKDVSKYTNILIHEIIDQKSERDRHDVADKLIQNIPATTLKKLMDNNGFLAEQLREMGNVYGKEVGELMKSTEGAYHSPHDAAKALNYIGSAGKLIEKRHIENAANIMIQRVLEHGVSYGNVNFANLCEAGFTDEVLKILSKGIKDMQVGVPTILGLKEKGYLNDEQVKNLALEANIFDIENMKNKIKARQERLNDLNKALENAERAASKNPDNEVNIEAYGLGKGKAKDLIIKYREYMQRDIKNQTEFLSGEENNLKRLEISDSNKVETVTGDVEKHIEEMVNKNPQKTMEVDITPDNSDRNTEIEKLERIQDIENKIKELNIESNDLSTKYVPEIKDYLNSATEAELIDIFDKNAWLISSDDRRGTFGDKMLFEKHRNKDSEFKKKTIKSLIENFENVGDATVRDTINILASNRKFDENGKYKTTEEAKNDKGFDLYNTYNHINQELHYNYLKKANLVKEWIDIKMKDKILSNIEKFEQFNAILSNDELFSLLNEEFDSLEKIGVQKNWASAFVREKGKEYFKESTT